MSGKDNNGMSSKQRCEICKKQKEDNEFLSRKSICKSCSKLIRNKKSQENRKEKKLELKIMALIYKGSKCVDCGIKFPDYPPIIFDFHHELPSEKNIGINSLMKVRSTLNELKEELDKCVLLCSNCHRIRHKPESKLYQTYVKEYSDSTK